MLSFNNDPALKEKFVESAIRHRDLDMLLAGTYSTVDSKGKFKGCSVGCFANDIKFDCDYVGRTPHFQVANYFHIPEWLVCVQDTIFEYLPESERSNWHVEFAEAIPVGVNLEPVLNKSDIMRFERLLEIVNYDTTTLLLKEAIELHKYILANNHNCPPDFKEIKKIYHGFLFDAPNDLGYIKKNIISHVFNCASESFTRSNSFIGNSMQYFRSIVLLSANDVLCGSTRVDDARVYTGRMERDTLLTLLKNEGTT